MVTVTTEAHDTAMETDHSPSSNDVAPSSLQSRIIQSKSIQQENADISDSSPDDEVMEADSVNVEQPTFRKLSAQASRVGGKAEYRRIRCPAHRYTPLRENWEQLLTPLVEVIYFLLLRSMSSFTLLNI